MARSRLQAWTTLERLFQFGLFVLGSVFAISLAVALDRFQAALGADWRAGAPDAQLSAVLFVLTFILIMEWYLAIQGELQMLKDYGEEFLPPLPNLRVYPMLLGALLALLLFFSNDPLVYGLLIVALKLVERVGFDHDAYPRMRLGFADARERAAADDPRRQSWDVIETYYFGHRHRQLWAIMTALCVVALALAVGDRLRAVPVLTSAAYVVLLIAIAINEVTYTLWRRQRDRALGDSY